MSFITIMSISNKSGTYCLFLAKGQPFKKVHSIYINVYVSVYGTFFNFNRNFFSDKFFLAI